MQLNQTNIKDYVSNYMQSQFALDKRMILDSENFFQDGLVDSFGFMQLIMEMERVYQITFEPEELITDSFINLENIAKAIEKKLIA